MSSTVYYRDDAVTVFHGDCLEVLPQIAPQSVDLVLTDPPFFMPAAHYQSRTQWQRSWGDTSILAAFWGRVLDAAIPAMRRTGHLLTFCNGDSYPVFYPETYRRFDALSSLVWDKGRIGMGAPWRKQHELILTSRWAGSYRSVCTEAVRMLSGTQVLEPTSAFTQLISRYHCWRS